MTLVMSVILWVLGLGLVGMLAMLIYQFIYWRLKGVPCLDSVPLLGLNGPIFLNQKSFVELTEELYNACPGSRYFGGMDINTPVLVIKDPDLVKEISVKSFDYFPNHQSFVDENFDPVMARNVFSLKDDRWRKMRTTLSPAFTANKMKYMFELVSKCALDFVRYLEEHPALARDLDLKDVYTRYTNDVIATTAFGISVDSMKDRRNDFYLHGKKATSANGWLNSLKFIMSRIFPKLMRHAGLTFLPKDTQNFFKRLIGDTVRMRDETGTIRPDMIHLLMQARDNENGIAMTVDDIVAQAFIFFFAGFETSSQLMCLVSHLLAYHPEVQERLRKEVDQVFDKANIDYDTLSQMKYMDMVVSETLRLYPPSPITDRLCVKPYPLPAPNQDSKMPLVVQPNTSLWLPISGFHHDPNFFPNPEEFDPERFNENNKNNIKPYTYMPFGVGPRKCIAERFALMETKILIAYLLRHFVFEPSVKTTKKIIFAKDAFSPLPVNGFWLNLQPRIFD